MDSTLLKKFKDDGYVVLPDFLSLSECDTLENSCYRLIEDMNPDEHRHVFSTGDKTETQRDEYFLDSADKIGYFFETEALDLEGALKYDKHKCLNKIGHGLHFLAPQFQEVTFSEKVKQIFRTLNFITPRIPQSMCIFKPPHIGGKVSCHQDATFLHTSPPNKVIGVWVALEDAAVDNGCLEFIPGSHKNGIDNNSLMVRNVDSDGNFVGNNLLKFTSEIVQRPDDEFIRVPISKGSAIIIDGFVVHRSGKNLSDRSRHIYTFHVYESHDTTWCSTNWLQPTKEHPSFPVLYNDASSS